MLRLAKSMATSSAVCGRQPTRRGIPSSPITVGSAHERRQIGALEPFMPHSRVSHQKSSAPTMRAVPSQTDHPRYRMTAQFKDGDL